MKYICYFILLSSVLSAQTNAGRKEITPFIKTSVLLKDTAKIANVAARGDGNMSMHEYNDATMAQAHYLSPQQFAGFQSAMWAVVKSPKSKAYQYYGAKPWTSKELRERMMVCDSVTESFLDGKGQEVQQNGYRCDSISRLRHISKIDFYESWYFNPSTNMIEKEILGYCVWEYIEEWKAYRGLFNVFKDQAAADKVKKYMDY